MLNSCSEKSEFTLDQIKKLTMKEVLCSHEDEINSVDFSKDGKYFLTSGGDRQILIFNQSNDECIKKINYPYTLSNVIFTHDSKFLLASSNEEFKIILISLLNEEVIFAFTGHQDKIVGLVMHPKEDVFISTSNEFETRVWNLNNRNCLLKIIDSVCAAFNPNGKVFASVTEKFSEGTNKNELSYVNIYMYPNIREGPVFATKLEHKGNLLHIMFSHDELWLCIEDVEENVYVLNTIDFSCILKLQNINLSQKETPYRFHISPCSNFIAMPYISGDLLIWNLLSGKVENTLNSNKNKMNLVKFCPFSRKVITTTNKGEIIIWTVN